MYVCLFDQMNLILLKVTMLLWLPINTLHTKCDRVYILLTVNTSHPLLWVMQFSPPLPQTCRPLHTKYPSVQIQPNCLLFCFKCIGCSTFYQCLVSLWAAVLCQISGLTGILDPCSPQCKQAITNPFN